MNKPLRLMSLVAAIFIALAVFTGCSSSDDSEESSILDEIYYYPADYEEDIFENPSYINKVTDVKFINGGYSYIVSAENSDSFGEDAEFFYRYFDSIKHGDAEGYNSFFDDEYFTDSNPRKEKFTMQKLYDIEVEYQDDLELEYKDEKIPVRDYLVRYRIMYNNGTFRKGIPSDAAVPQHYLISEIDGETKILNIVDIK